MWRATSVAKAASELVAAIFPQQRQVVIHVLTGIWPATGKGNKIICGVVPKRRRAAAVQQAGANFSRPPCARSVLKCASRVAIVGRMPARKFIVTFSTTSISMGMLVETSSRPSLVEKRVFQTCSCCGSTLFHLRCDVETLVKPVWINRWNCEKAFQLGGQVEIG